MSAAHYLSRKSHIMRYTILFACLLVFSACSNPTEEATKTETMTEEVKIEYPAELVKVFDNHGGLDKWKSMKGMSYEIEKEGGNEKQTIDLQNRREMIEASNFTSGFDGKAYWVVADTSYKGNPKFYTNLMFYFYAMPFVLADEGITYSETEPIVYEGVSYPGIRISYGDGVGISPEDEYFIHYDANTHEMAWLGYTVTYFSGEKSNKKSYIRYDDWKKFNGLKLPNSATWFKVEDGKLIGPRNTRQFKNVVVSEKAFDNATFAVPEGAKVVD